MNWASVHRVARYCIPLAVVALFFAASIGISHGSMSMDEDGHMHDCPYMGMAAICQMDPLEHIAAWQSRFAALTVRDSLTVLALALIAFAIVGIWQRQRFRERQPLQHLRHRRETLLAFSNYLAEALSSGILHPKVF